MTPELILPEDRFFDPEPRQKEITLHLYRGIAGLPLICPHGHVDPRLFAENSSLGDPTELFIIPDHYVFRMLYSQGIPMEAVGVPPVPGSGVQVESDHRKIWQIFAENFHLFRGTPSGIWLNHELYGVFGVRHRLEGESAQEIYDQIAAQLASPEFSARRLFERFNIEVLTTTDFAADPLTQHQALIRSGWQGRILPTFRPDAVVNLETKGWKANLQALSQACGMDIHDYSAFIRALENRRAFFKSMGAAATDHAALTAATGELPESEADDIFQHALHGEVTSSEAARFMGHMLVELARMSCEDGLVMQLHVGSLRNHNQALFERFGYDKGYDIPVAGEFTRGLQPLLNRFGSDPRLSLVLFTLDESVYARELAPLAGHYPALKLGPPWWFHDSLNGMRRYFDQVMETAGIYNTAGFNDDTRAFASIPARHDVWRRASANWLAGLVARSIIDLDEADLMAHELAYGLAKKAYRL
jgi:glucuronate isomerase